jgi:predicted acylesterase/phospholipase RssA
LGHVKEVLGISAGSLFALLWVLEYTVEQIEQLALEFDFTLLRNIDPDSIFEFSTRFGLDDGSGIEKLVTSILRHKGFGPDATFQQIAVKYPTRFRCFATEVETSRVRQFGTLTTPNVSVKLAVRASMALPIFYTPVKDPQTGRLLLDGGLLNNLPIVFLNENEMRDTLCVFFTRWEYGKVVPITTMMDMLNGIYDSAMILKSRPYVEKYKDCIVVVPTCDFGAMSFEESRESREKLVAEAYKRTSQFLFTQHWRPTRRFSVS